MASSSNIIVGIKMPQMLYGTAWKKEKTTAYVVQAVLSGFRGIDTACQPKHYRQDLVGDALVLLKEKHNISREDLFLQTKFTSLDGQDPKNIPYDPKSSIAEQVKTSLEKSLSDLHTTYLDSLVLHSPMRTFDETMVVWKLFEGFKAAGKVRMLGISNCYDEKVLTKLYEQAKVKPEVVQNRFYPEKGHDKEIRKFCKENNIVYQSFWTLTGNPEILSNKDVRAIAAKLNISPEQVMYRWVMDIGITPLNGTCSKRHMEEDLKVVEMPSLSNEDRETLNSLI